MAASIIKLLPEFFPPVNEWMTTMAKRRFTLAVAFLLVCITGAQAQPTYKLGVKPDLKPQATLQLEGGRVTRSDVADDPGFRLQYHIQKAGKTLALVDARASKAVDLPQSEPGVYGVTLELFHPDYKGGNAQKGGFRPISNVILYLAYKDASGKVVVTDLDRVRTYLFYGLTAGKLIPVPGT
jgi:hypothetical protein